MGKGNEPSEVMIALMGPTGTGKSTFISLLTKNEGIKIGHDLESQTVEVLTASCIVDGRRITLVDTPGFDDSRQGVTDTHVLTQIVNFFQAKKERRFNGIIYLHRISDPRITGSAKKNLRMFRELCGDKKLHNVRIVTTFWSKVEKSEGDTRQTQLANGAFKPLIEGGAKLVVLRRDQELESAQQIVSELSQLPPVKLKIQEELDAGKPLADTSAGAVIMEEMKQLEQKHREEMADLTREMEEAAMDDNEDLEAELAKLQTMIAQLDNNRKRMKDTNAVPESTSSRDRIVPESVPIVEAADLPHPSQAKWWRRLFCCG